MAFLLPSLLLLLITFTLLIRRLLSPLSSLPGPLITRFTSLPLIYQEFTSNRRLYIHSLHQKYGPVVRLGPNEVSFISLDALKEIYTSGGSGYDKTELYTLFMQFSTRTMFSTLGKADHSQKKRYIAGQYANTNILRPTVLAGIQNRADAFVQKCIESEGKSLDAYVYLHCYALDCASHHLFHPYGTHSLEGGKDFEMMEEQTYHESLKSNLAQYYTPPSIANILLKLLKPRPSPLSNAYVLETCKKLNASKQSLLSKLQEGKSNFSAVAIAAESADHLAAGIDTTGDGLTFLLHQLSLPSSLPVQSKLHASLLATPQDDTYLDAVIKETLRLFPPIPMSAPRYVPPGGREISGHFIPEGTIVGCQSWSVHRLNEVIYPKSEEFIPERWLDPNLDLDMERLFFAFGAGGRGCVGRHLAMSEMKCLVRSVYSKFKTSIADDMVGSMEMDDQIISSRPKGQTCRLVFEGVGADEKEEARH